jgi:hypothetical protein
VFLRELKGQELIGSMGRVGACDGNAAVASFFALLQVHVMDTRRLRFDGLALCAADKPAVSVKVCTCR